MEQEANSTATLRLEVEGEKGVYFFENEKAVGVVLPGDMTSINSKLIRRIITTFEGFSLAIVTLSGVSHNL